jgi:hypothetical protein
MEILATIAGIVLIFVILWDGFETIILPRRVTRSVRLTRIFYRATWVPWSAAARAIRRDDKRENMLSYYGPLSLILLLIFWALCLILGFALVQWGLGAQLSASNGRSPFLMDIYLSMNAFFTLGFGDTTPHSTASRMLAVVEGGTGYGFLAMVISYLPALNNAFSHREVNVSMLDERAGSPPTASRILIHHQQANSVLSITQFMLDWEHWAAELMESHLSFPVLAYFRSQHQNQSWVSALAMILDASALVQVGIDDVPAEPARLAFAMARHAAVDLTQVFNTPPQPPAADRLPPQELARLRAALAEAGIALRAGPEADRQLCELREMYEPYINALGRHLLVKLPPWMPDPVQTDNWQTSAWEK